VKAFHRINGCLATKDNRDSWEMCITSTECKIVMTDMLTVMSGMVPHTIRVTWVGMVEMLGVGQSCTYFEPPQWTLWYVRCRVSRRAFGFSSISFWHRMEPPLSASQARVSPPLISPHVIFPHLPSGNYKPTEACLLLP
jgi:hypothetical protein